MCNAGEQGEACESDDACCGIGLCRALLDIPGILAWRSCGECTSDADCPPGGTCQPDVSLSPIGGIWQCVLPSSLPLDHTCDPTNAAVAPCDGVCEPIDLEGLATIGVCGECSASADCTAGQTCQPGSADLETGALSGSRCV
jgi:Cys-rich repeat protein